MEFKQVWRFYTERLSEGAEVPATLELPAEESHFAHSVLRLSEGEQIELADGKGWLAQARLVRSGKKSVAAEVESFKFFPRTENRIVALVGMTKPGALEEIVQVSVEAGVSELIFYKGDRTTSKQDLKIDKLTKQIREISRITKSPWLMNVCCQENLASALNYARQISRFDRLLVCDERPAHLKEDFGSTRHLLLEGLKSSSGDVAFAVGPESSFSRGEYELFASEERRGTACFVSLGPRILRTPAAVASAAYVLAGVHESRLDCSKLGI